MNTSTNAAPQADWDFNKAKRMQPCGLDIDEEEIESILAGMPSRVSEFTGQDKSGEGASRPSPGFFAGLDLLQHMAANIINRELDPLTWVLRESLLSATLGLLCGPPGVGKSTFLLQLAASIATGLPWFGDRLVPGSKGSVLAVFCEEDERILNRRVQRVFKALPEVLAVTPWPKIQASASAIKKDFLANLITVPAAGRDVRLLHAGPSREPEPSQVFDELLARAKSIPDLKLIILDPLSRLYGQNENDNAMATYFCSLLEQLAQETGASVIVNHHVGKGAGTDGKGKFNLNAAISPDVIRGASALTGAARWQLNLFSFDAKTARQELKNSAARDGQYLVAKVTKKNYGPPESPLFLQRGDGGILRPVAAQAEEEKRGLFEQITDKIIAIVRKHEEDGKPSLTIKRLKETYTAQWKEEVSGVSQDKVGAAANMAVDEGKLFLITRKAPGGKTSAAYLSTTPEADSEPGPIDAGDDAGRRTPGDAGQDGASGDNILKTQGNDAGNDDAGENGLPGAGTRVKSHAGRRAKTAPKGGTADLPSSAVPPGCNEGDERGTNSSGQELTAEDLMWGSVDMDKATEGPEESII